MVLTFKSSTPEQFRIENRDSAGRVRSVTASKDASDFHWKLRLQHPSGRHWEATYHGAGVLDAMSELLTSKDAEFKQDKARGDRPHEAGFDYNRSVDGYVPPITPIHRRS